MSKIRDAFADGKVFIPFLTAGDPNLEKPRNIFRNWSRPERA